MQNQNRTYHNLGSKDFKLHREVSNKDLREAKRKNRPLRNMKLVVDAKKNPDNYSIHFGVCWMCWMDLTRKYLQNWRKYPYSEITLHKATCPLCNYEHWRGRVWYPFRLLRGYIGNPSRRDFK